MALKKILLTDDISNFSARGKRRSYQIRNLAANICNALQAHLDFLYVEDLPEDLRKRKSLARLDKRSPQLVAQLKKDLEKLTPDCEIHIDQGSPREKVLSWSQKINPEMIIIGTRGARGLGKLFFGSVAEEVVRHSTVPVIVVGPKVTKMGFTVPGKKNRILLLTDLTRASKSAEDFAKRIALNTNAQVTILYSIGDQIKQLKDVYYRSRIPIFALDEQISEIKKWAREELKKRSEQFKAEGLSVQTEMTLEEREVKKEISRKLMEDFSLLVMGTHSRSKIMTSFIGSTARDTCLTSSVPVAIVRSK